MKEYSVRWEEVHTSIVSANNLEEAQKKAEAQEFSSDEVSTIKGDIDVVEYKVFNKCTEKFWSKICKGCKFCKREIDQN